jgi:hypothetical protein
VKLDEKSDLDSLVFVQKPKQVSQEVKAGIAAGNINITTADSDVLDLSEDSQLAIKRQVESVALQWQLVCSFSVCFGVAE